MTQMDRLMNAMTLIAAVAAVALTLAAGTSMAQAQHSQRLPDSAVHSGS